MNFTLTNKKFGKIALILTIMLFLWVSTFGLIYHMDQMKMQGSTDGCMFSASSKTQICPMNLSEHLTLWESMFISLPQNTELLGMLILVIALFFIIVFWQNPFKEFSRRVSFRFKLYTKQHSQISKYKIETIHWLSLFENSPSFMYARHS